jgi:hypothetical protein
MPFQTILDLLPTSSRPLNIMFRRNSANNPKLTITHRQTDADATFMQTFVGETLSNDILNVTPLDSNDISRFHVTFKIGSRTGLRFIRSAFGNMAIVDGCNVEECRRAIIGDFRIPRSGAVVLGLNSSLGIMCEDVLDSMHSFEELSNLANDTNKSSSFTLTFLEAHSAS